jgi:hypothetical protein
MHKGMAVIQSPAETLHYSRRHFPMTSIGLDRTGEEGAEAIESAHNSTASRSWLPELGRTASLVGEPGLLRTMLVYSSRLRVHELLT